MAMKAQNKIRSNQRERGMTLIELMIALVILAVGLGALAILFMTAMQTNNKNAKDTTATMMAQTVLEKITAEPADSIVNLNMTDCANNAWAVATAAGGATVNNATGDIDQTQSYNAAPANYKMLYVACGAGGTQTVYDVRWNVQGYTPFMRFVTVSARESQGNGVAQGLGRLHYAQPVTLRGIGGMKPN